MGSFSNFVLRWRLAALLLLTIPAGCATNAPNIPAKASNEQIKACLEAATAESRLALCTAVVNSGVSDPSLLAKAYFMRGTGWQSKGDFGRAIADFNQAISLDSGLAVAYMWRAALRDAQGDYDGAIADYSQAIRLNPKDAAAYNNRACAFNAKGEFEKAMLDLETALRLDPDMYPALVNRAYMAVGEGRFSIAAEHFARAMRIKPPSAYNLLWYYVARVRSETNTENASIAKTELADRSAKLTDSAFALRVVDFYLSRLNEATIRARASHINPRIRQEQVCLVDYFAGQWHLMRGDKALGMPMLQAVVRNCPVNFHERWAAELELRKVSGR
jgi:lipoprotein NlpI